MKKKFYTPPYTRSKGVMLEETICAVPSGNSTQVDKHEALVMDYNDIDNTTGFNSTGFTEDNDKGIVIR